jgi:hypothetical protein
VQPEPVCAERDQTSILRARHAARGYRVAVEHETVAERGERLVMVMHVADAEQACERVDSICSRVKVRAPLVWSTIS